MQILFIEPYDTGSHAAWMRGYAQHSRHSITILSLPGQFWQWRLLGGAVTLATQYKSRSAQPDLIIASDMLDVATFVALAKPDCPVMLYFHENQLLYPRGPRQKLQNHYAFINYTSALVADAVRFNSQFHLHAFIDELPRLLKHFPDHNNLETIDAIRKKSDVLSLGVDLARFDTYAPTSTPSHEKQPPLILWNHRWEFDKNPELFTKTILRLHAAGYDFRVAITGENFQQNPVEFANLPQQLGERVVQLGYLPRFEDYARLLWQADIVVSTAIQEFFGISTVEALYCRCWPVLPNRLNYPYLLPHLHHQQALYNTDEGLYHRLAAHLQPPCHRPAAQHLRDHIAVNDWQMLAPIYDSTLQAVARP
jgi:glycosyltransferase involved in cell wall biosynthesis